MIVEGQTADDFTVKVIDFGIVKAARSVATDPRALTRNGFIGTPVFASARQWTNNALDVRSNVFSLGATLCYLLTGRTPSDRNRPAAILPMAIAPITCAKSLQS